MTTNRHQSMPWFLVPAVLWLAVFLVAPLIVTLVLSFAKKGAYGVLVFDWNTDNFARLLDPLYVQVFLASLKLAVQTVIVCLLLGYPLALWMARSPKRQQKWLVSLIMLPFMTNFIIRAHGIKIILSDRGFIHEILAGIGIISADASFSEGFFSVWFGMITNYLPFMVLPLFAALEKFDFSLVEAARDLGASRWMSFILIVLPLTSQAIMSGCILVFMPALGEFIIPDFLGGAKVMLIGNLITDQFLKSRDWPFGAALSVVLLVSVFIPFWWQTSRGQRTEGAHR